MIPRPSAVNDELVLADRQRHEELPDDFRGLRLAGDGEDEGMESVEAGAESFMNLWVFEAAGRSLVANPEIVYPDSPRITKKQHALHVTARGVPKSQISNHLEVVGPARFELTTS